MIKKFFETEVKGIPKGKGILRFNLLFLVPIWIILGILIHSHFGRSTPLFATVAVGLVVLLSSVTSLAWLIAHWNTAQRLATIRSTLKRVDLHASEQISTASHKETAGREMVEASEVSHIVVVTCYQEPLSLINATISSLAQQSDAQRIRVAVGFEERSSDLEEKSDFLKSAYADKFLNFVVTVHPEKLPGEIAGKCSNVNYCVREVVKTWQLDVFDRFKHVILTTCDSDNLFHREHFRELRLRFQTSENRQNMVWQAPLFYDWNLEKSRFFTRNTGHSRTLFICGLLAPLSVNSMSIQSVSLDLCLRGNFFHPSYQMEDILNTVRWMTETQGVIKIEVLNLPVMSGPTSGKDFKDEAREWAAQASRWTIGSAEVFHYFLSRARQIPGLTASKWGLLFFSYYAFLIPVAPFLSLTWALLGDFGFASQSGTAFEKSLEVANQVMFLNGAIQILSMLVLHSLRSFWARLLPVREKLSLVSRVTDALLFPLCQLAYGAVAVWSIHLLAVKGRAVCGHVASDKENLVNSSEPMSGLRPVGSTSSSTIYSANGIAVHGP